MIPAVTVSRLTIRPDYEHPQSLVKRLVVTPTRQLLRTTETKRLHEYRNAATAIEILQLAYLRCTGIVAARITVLPLPIGIQ